VIGYIAPPRLASRGAQLLQGDILASAPILQPVESGEAVSFASPALVLTPTCDFALKTGHEQRAVVAIERLDPHSPLLERLRDGTLPLHHSYLPPLDALFPAGGVVNFRRISPIHAARLAACPRVATLTAGGVRALLAAHWRYYARVDVDAASVTLPTDDPRLLWEALDAAAALPGLAERRWALSTALEGAIAALARHHGMGTSSSDASMARLTLLSDKGVLPPATRSAVAALDNVRTTLIALYQVVPRDPQSRASIFQDVVAQLESIAVLLQEAQPLQLTPHLLREAGLANLLR
jgi:hypothetical protein